MSTDGFRICGACGRKLALRFDRCVYCGGELADPGTPPVDRAAAVSHVAPAPTDDGLFELAEEVRQPRARVGERASSPSPAPVPPPMPQPERDVAFRAPQGPQPARSRARVWRWGAGLLAAGAVLFGVRFLMCGGPTGTIAARLRALVSDCDAATATIARCFREEAESAGRDDSQRIEAASNQMAQGCQRMRSGDPEDYEWRVQSMPPDAAKAAEHALELQEALQACARSTQSCVSVTRCIRAALQR